MIAGYYQARGWNEDGSVPNTKLADLGLLDLLPVSSGVTISA
jgi:aldehyde:ferredoxin oxidoreductase